MNNTISTLVHAVMTKNPATVLEAVKAKLATMNLTEAAKKYEQVKDKVNPSQEDK